MLSPALPAHEVRWAACSFPLPPLFHLTPASGLKGVLTTHFKEQKEADSVKCFL